MNKLKIMLCAVFSLLLVNTTAQADSSNFAGPYIGITGSGYGLQLDGTSDTSPTGAAPSFDRDEVQLGAVSPVMGFEAGYAIPLGSMFLLDIGAATYSGEAELEFFQDEASSTRKDLSFTVDDLMSGYIAPTIVLSDTSSLYIKVGLTEAQVTTSGGITPAADLSGQTWAMGTRTVLESGIFIRTEAGYTDFNGISAHGMGDGVDATNSYSADPSVAYGAVSLGFRF